MLYSRTLLFIYLIYTNLYLLIPNSQFIPPHPSPFWQLTVCSLCLWICFCFVDKFICIIFWIPHVSDVIWYFSLSDWLHLVWSSVAPSMWLQMVFFHSFLYTLLLSDLNDCSLCLESVLTLLPPLFRVICISEINFSTVQLWSLYFLA